MKRYTLIALTVGLLFFYMSIVMYVFFAVLHISTLKNFEYAMAFEIIGFLMLTYFIMCNWCGKKIKTGVFVPLMLFTIVYTLILDIVNMVFVTIMPNVFFVLINFVLLFIYCLISIPMYVIGRR